MDEVKRFLRFTLPGLACVLLVLLALSVSDPDIVRNVLSKDCATSIGEVAVFFLGSGGLGYILANVYFAAYWLPLLSKWWAIDHRSVLEQLGDKVKIIDPSGKSLLASNLSRREAWQIVSQFWYSKIGPG